MNAKYPVTKNLSDYAISLRKECLKYNLEDFADVMGHSSKTWAFNLETRKLKEIAIDDIWQLFLVKYNYNRFINKKDQLVEFVEDAIERGYVRKTTFEKMFDKKIPTAIFKGQPLKVPEGYSRGGYGAECDVLFSEDKFPEEERYIFSQFINRYELEKNQLAAIENFILDEINEIKKDRGESLKYDYWLYAMELMVKDVEIKKPLWERIKFICFDDEYMRQNTEFKWRHIYSILNENCSLADANYYATPNVVYFDNQKQPMSDENLPSFNIRYDINKMRTTGEDETDYFELKLESGVGGKIKLIDLFMILHRKNYLESINKDKQVIFRKTCIDLLDYIKAEDIPFLKLNLFPVPMIEDKPLDVEIMGLIHILNEFYKDPDTYDAKTNTYKIKEKFKNNKELMQFRDNIRACTERFINVISIDFSFINKLPMSKDKLLRDELDEVVKKFKKKNLR